MKQLFPTLTATVLCSALLASGFQCEKDECASLSKDTYDITPVAGPCGADCPTFFFDIDFLYWSARQGHLPITVKTPTEQLVSIDPLNPLNEVQLLDAVSCGRVIYPDWKYEPGFKIGAGFCFLDDGWDFYANYTWMRNNSTKNRITAKQGESLTFLFGENNPSIDGRLFGFEGSTANGKWEFSFDTLDALLRRNFYISSCLKLRPQLGLKASWQSQSFSSNYDLLFDDIVENFSVRTLASDRYKIDYWGVGLIAGCDSSWQFTDYFALYGNMRLSALWEHYDAKERIVEEFPSIGLTNVIADLKTTINTIQPVIELGLGLRFDFECFEDSFLSLAAGWEKQYWANTNLILVTDPFFTQNRDLALQGLTVKIALDF